MIGIRIKIHYFTGDAPARAKVCNSHQYNGSYGCLHCLHPTERINKTTLYPFIDYFNVGLRSNQIYLNQIKEADKSSNLKFNEML